MRTLERKWARSGAFQLADRRAIFGFARTKAFATSLGFRHLFALCEIALDVITDVGREALEHAGRVMLELEAIRSTVGTVRSDLRGMVTIGLPPTVSELITVPLAQRIASKHPHLVLRFSSAFSGHLRDWLQEGELDIVVSYNPKPLKSLRNVPVMTEDLLHVTAGQRSKKPVPFARFGDMRLVLPGPRHALRTLIEQCAHQAGIKLRPTIETDSLNVMTDLVRAGFGATVLPLAPIHGYVKRGDLTAAPLTDPAPVRKLVLAFAADRPVSPAARYVGETIQSLASEMIESGNWRGLSAVR